MQTEYRRLAGIDVHKKMLAVVVRSEEGGKPQYEERKFGTTQSEIRDLAAWLQEQRVDEVVMESTAQYWRPVWYGLESHFRLHLTHPLKTRAPQGRKRDFRDARRLADRWMSGDLEESFIPGAAQRQCRWLTRSRVQLRRLIVLARNRVEGLLEQGGIKLTSVVTDTFGVSGWAMLERLANGESDPVALASEARGALCKKEERLREALAGRLEPTYCFLLKQTLEQVKLLRRQIQDLDNELAVAMRDHLPTLSRLMKIPGVDRVAAEELLAEIGPTAAAFPSAGQLASWVGVCPGSRESAGICHSSRSAKGNCYLRRILAQIAWAALHTKDTFFQGVFVRLKPRIEAKGAAWAVAHRIAGVVWLLLHEGVEYQERGPGQPNPETLARKLRRLMQQFARAGIDPEPILKSSLPAPA
jgi:transposase